MTRDAAKQNLISIGVTEPTEEQITNYLNQVNGEIKKEKEKTDKYKADAEKAAELQKRVEELEAGNLSETEKANKALETANARIAELEKASAITNQRNAVVEKFKVTAEQASQIVKEDGSMDYDVLGQIISEKETAAANAKEQEIANKASNPGGGGGGKGNGEEKTTAEKLVEKHFAKEKGGEDILSHYV